MSVHQRPRRGHGARRAGPFVLIGRRPFHRRTGGIVSESGADDSPGPELMQGEGEPDTTRIPYLYCIPRRHDLGSNSDKMNR